MRESGFIKHRILEVTFASVICLFAFMQEAFCAETYRSNVNVAHSSPIALSSDDKLLWAINADLNEVVVIRTDTLSVIKTIAVGSAPRSVTLSSNGKYAYVANGADGTVSVIRILSSYPDSFSASLDTNAGRNGLLTTGAEPSGMVLSADGALLFVANSSQDTVTSIDTKKNRIIGSYSLRGSACNELDNERHFHPSALAVTQNNRYLLVTRFLSFTAKDGVQADDFGKEGLVCRLTVDAGHHDGNVLGDPVSIHMRSRNSGFRDLNGNIKYAFPNQLQNIVVRDGTAYLPNIAASPHGPVYYETTTQAFVNAISGIDAIPKDVGALNLHLGGRIPEKGKQELYFANPDAIAFTTGTGEGYAYVASGGSDVLVKLRVMRDGSLAFTEGSNTTRYVDLNDPDGSATSGYNAGKNPIGLVINSTGNMAYVLNNVSRNVSVVDLKTDHVTKVVSIGALPAPGSQEERKLVGEELFFSSRGNFENPSGLGNSRNRLSEKGRQSCASCHPAGLTDGVVWQFNTGPRKTLAINGTFNPRDPSDQKIINASAIFDELEDADFNTRHTSSPGFLKMPRPCNVTPGYPNITESKIDPDHGLVLGAYHDFQKAPCVMTQFSVPNSGRAQATVLLPGSSVEVPALDALKEWQHYGVRTPMRAMTGKELREKDGDVTGSSNEGDIAEGRKIFQESGCSNCHNTGKWSASSKNFSSPPAPGEIETELSSTGANQYQFLYKYLKNIESYNLNVAGSKNLIQGFQAIGGIEKDSAGLKALGYDHDGDGKGAGYTISAILGTYSLQPYYHNGACETLHCVVSDANHKNAGQPSLVKQYFDKRKEALLVEFLESIDAKTEPFD